MRRSTVKYAQGRSVPIPGGVSRLARVGMASLSAVAVSAPLSVLDQTPNGAVVEAAGSGPIIWTGRIVRSDGSAAVGASAIASLLPAESSGGGPLVEIARGVADADGNIVLDRRARDSGGVLPRWRHRGRDGHGKSRWAVVASYSCLDEASAPTPNWEPPNGLTRRPDCVSVRASQPLTSAETRRRWR